MILILALGMSCEEDPNIVSGPILGRWIVQTAEIVTIELNDMSIEDFLASTGVPEEEIDEFVDGISVQDFVGIQYEFFEDNEVLIINGATRGSFVYTINDDNTILRIINAFGQNQVWNITQLDENVLNFTQEIPSELNDLDGDGVNERFNIEVNLETSSF